MNLEKGLVHERLFILGMRSIQAAAEFCQSMCDTVPTELDFTDKLVPRSLSQHFYCDTLATASRFSVLIMDEQPGRDNGIKLSFWAGDLL